jgi:uncharacterized protein YecA (UPF0149 family)
MAPSDPGWNPIGGDDTYQYSATVLSVFWPEAEHEELIARSPHLAAEVGATWDEHRQQVEQHCTLVERHGHSVSQFAADVPGLEAFLQDKGVAKPSAEDLHAYPDMRTQPAMIHWPPARTAPCWCGSERKYEQCCRRHGLGSLD